ncbi:MAG: hypothetical protein MUF71_04355 [Candidatus Kapabacteria bacterium]|nr:hypothetical protein [Candidatus Kapabacteria bacterium]
MLLASLIGFLFRTKAATQTATLHKQLSNFSVPSWILLSILASGVPISILGL